MSESERVFVATNRAASKVVGVLIASCHQALVVSTPVDTGFASSSWVPSVGTVSSRPDPAPAQKEVARSIANSRLQENRSRAALIERTYRINQGAGYIASNAPYMPRLNDGYSSRAPKNFVEQAIALAVKSTAARFSRFAG